MTSVKSQVIDVFDDIAEKRAWENLYSETIESGKIGRTGYNFVARRRAVAELIDPYAQGALLDIGCGTGDLAPIYAARDVAYTGVDLSSQMIERAHENFSELIEAGKAKFEVADCEELPLGDQMYDVVTAVALIEYLPDASAALDEIVRVTKAGGYALVTVPYSRCINTYIRWMLKPIVKLLVPIYALLKRQPLLAMKDVKHYDYNEEELDGMMKQRGCELVEFTYTNFHVVPFILDQLFPRLYIRLSEKIDRGGKAKRYRRWASNYIALYRKS